MMDTVLNCANGGWFMVAGGLITYGVLALAGAAWSNICSLTGTAASQREPADPMPDTIQWEWIMTSKLMTVLAITGGLLASTAVFAADNAPSSEPSAPGMMRGPHGMMNMTGPMDRDHMRDHMKDMTAMAESCDRMMQSMSGSAGGAQQPGPSPQK